jgi:hypothetical protein
MENEEKNIIKSLKSYLLGKKLSETNKDKSYEYFKQCIKLINSIRDKNLKIDDKYTELLEETEIECSKLLSKNICDTIDENNIIFNNNEDEIFSIIETSDIHKLKKMDHQTLNLEVYNNIGLSPGHFAIKFGDTNILKQLFKFGLEIDQTNKSGLSLLEFACLEEDANIINFLELNGADMIKHVDFRKGNKYNKKGNQIDIVLLQKIIIEIPSEYTSDVYKIKHLEFIYNFFNPDDFLDLEYKQKGIKIKLKELIVKLDILIDNFNEESKESIITILKEELSYDLSNKLGCPSNKMNILLSNLIPFINYSGCVNDETFKYKLRLRWLISLEIKFMILNILKNLKKLNTKYLKEELMKKIYNSYIKNNIIPLDLIQTIVLQWFSKIKI